MTDGTEPKAAELSGLTAAAARERFVADGPNELPRPDRRSAFRILGEVVREPMLALLIAGGVAYLLLGDMGEALILLVFCTFSIAITVVQETRTEHVLEALRDLASPRALVIRDGAHTRIAGREVVQGDLIVLEQGGRVAADAVLVAADDLQADESLLTGESLPVRKRVANSDETIERRPGGDDQPIVYSGSLVTSGGGVARVVATGPRSEIGKIGQSLAALDPEPPRLRRETARIVRYCAIGGGAVALLVVVLFGLLRGGWIEAMLAGIAIGMAMLPEEFPVVLMIFLATGAWRIAKSGVLTRRAAAIETLGSATVLCTDKTGTLTENRMAVAQVWLASGETATVDGAADLAAPFHRLIDTSILASAPVAVDPMEVAFHEAGRRIPDGAIDHDGFELVHTYGLRPELLAMSNIWRMGDGCIIAAKGAPEAIATLCRLPPEQRAAMTAAVDAMAEKGMRVLGVASASRRLDGVKAPGAWPDAQQDHDYALIGLIGLADPLRASVPAAVAECRSAGIRVVMITGDYAATARSIATQAGIIEGDVLTGTEMAALDDAQLAARIESVSVFARIMPEQKLRIVTAFKTAGEIVAMTGDGINDAPSLKAAHIGIAMGKRGTDVAREASAIVLLDDDFGSIVTAVRLGRRIYDNIRKAMGFIFAVHVPIAGLALLPLVLGYPILFGPVHIALLEMIIDPVCALVFEAEPDEGDLMARKPRNPAEALFSLPMIVRSLVQGGLAFVGVAAVFLSASHAGMPEAEVRALVFFALVGAILALILANRSFDASIRHAVFRGNAALRYVLGAVMAMVAVSLLVPPIRELLKFGPLHGDDLALAAGSAVLLLLLLEGVKWLDMRRSRLGLA
jgi:Ca2+-transporting ATPase